MKRRSFLNTSAMASAGLLLAPAAVCAESPFRTPYYDRSIQDFLDSK